MCFILLMPDARNNKQSSKARGISKTNPHIRNIPQSGNLARTAIETHPSLPYNTEISVTNLTNNSFDISLSLHSAFLVTSHAVS